MNAPVRAHEFTASRIAAANCAANELLAAEIRIPFAYAVRLNRFAAAGI